MKNVWEWDDFRHNRRQPWKIPGVICRNIKYSWQRITKGYCDKDLWSIDYWFMSLMPDMLEQFKKTNHGSPSVLGEEYVDEDGIRCNDTCHAEWDAILEEMIFLFREMNEETCQKKNIYEEEHSRIQEEFKEKYGIFGEKLEEGKEEPKVGKRIHFASELPEYKDVEEKYHTYEQELSNYREECKNKAFELFSKWFYHLWD